MTDWTARIDALLAEKPNPREYRYRAGVVNIDAAEVNWLEARLWRQEEAKAELRQYRRLQGLDRPASEGAKR